MRFPDFFDQAPTITVHDGLAEFLGACTDGMITYRYIDAVRLAGHSCPTVAGAYLMTWRALRALYPDGTPERGALRVRFAAAQDEGVSGVIASVVGLITGAAGIGGFKGIGGNFQRQHLLQFDSGDDGEVVFERGDNGAAVRLSMHMHRVAADPGMSVLLRKILDGLATPDDQRAFATMWQDRVKRILIDHADDPDLFTVTSVAPPAAQ
ncbi:hypothetical protein H3H36_20605 [Duganella sp. FT3S]|uniref:Formylmethanofuran dehydrogenase subunit E domain-containing protein n=1 Tax=Rugamonas fusca TaxID=2758568 RepID=A0A7W2I8P2_9BURK|nr:FmdE family protein [Rugamonas fusca]MBA5607759.1 hypothetical protein [Rugamonas fusca]